MRISKAGWVAGLILLLSACTNVIVAPETGYSKQARHHLYQLDWWSFDGRLAVAAQNDSWTANLSWKHSPDQEELKLSGPLGQGATLVQLTEDFVSIDRGDGQVQTSEQPEEFVNQQLGMWVPVRSLRYWVVGLPEPSQAFVETTDGFTQAGWLVSYKQMQTVFNRSMPYKITVANSQAKLKLVIDQWNFNDTK